MTRILLSLSFSSLYFHRADRIESSRVELYTLQLFQLALRFENKTVLPDYPATNFHERIIFRSNGQRNEYPCSGRPRVITVSRSYIERNNTVSPRSIGKGDTDSFRSVLQYFGSNPFPTSRVAIFSSRTNTFVRINERVNDIRQKSFGWVQGMNVSRV